MMINHNNNHNNNKHDNNNKTQQTWHKSYDYDPVKCRGTLSDLVGAPPSIAIISGVKHTLSLRPRKERHIDIARESESLR